MIDNLVEEHCDKKMLENLNESLGDLDEGLPEPSDLLTTLPPWTRRGGIMSLFNGEETQEAIKEEPPKSSSEAITHGVEVCMIDTLVEAL